MSQSEQAQFWNTDSAQWRKQEEGAQPLYTKMIACMETKSGQSILDIGCGTGYFLSLFDKKQVVCHGIDLSESQLNYARTHLPQMEWKQASMDAIPYADHSFDWVSCNNALQFVPDPRLALTEFKRVMKKDAQLMVAVWDQPDRNDALLYF
ncbi:MAG TPA: class I SAM-dependent methyltransferase, partial [Chitinophagaceae bacterium]|nr:class I SAM-dependent methyltransferase [Chitinophagaceae bacterium]